MTIKENCKAVWDKLTCEACPFLCHGREVMVMGRNPRVDMISHGRIYSILPENILSSTICVISCDDSA